jgi:hypothetical protein
LYVERHGCYATPGPPVWPSPATDRPEEKLHALAKELNGVIRSTGSMVGVEAPGKLAAFVLQREGVLREGLRAAVLDEVIAVLDAFLREPLRSAPETSPLDGGPVRPVDPLDGGAMTLSDGFRERALARVRALKGERGAGAPPETPAWGLQQDLFDAGVTLGDALGGGDGKSVPVLAKEAVAQLRELRARVDAFERAHSQ